MTKKIAINWLIGAVILLSLANASLAENESDKSTKVIKEKPIVINTVAQHYQNPTLGEYQLCTKSRDDCNSKCGYSDDKCRAECPICPVLIDQDILVQGINDTLYRLPITSPKLNQTNIIRLTNEIRNIINTSLGNITTANQNNVNVYQNKTSRTGGKFGLGYTEKGPCCHLLEPQRCKRTTTSSHCGHKRLRTCGSHCISRVMRSKRVVTCNDTNPDDCAQAVEYIPQPRRPGCQYTSRWPFINCRGSTQHNAVSRRRSCTQCYKIPYGYVMRGQIPRECHACLGRSTVGQRRSYQPAPMYYGQYPMYQSYPSYPSYQSYYPPIAPPSFDYNYGNGWTIEDDGVSDEFDVPTSDSGWKVDERKCLNDDGTLTEKCPDDVDNEDEIISSSFPDEEGSDADFNTADATDYDYGDDLDVTGRRRHRRSHQY